MKHIITTSLAVFLLGCSGTETIHPERPGPGGGIPAGENDQCRPENPPGGTQAVDPPPAGFNGLPWRACVPLTGSRLCTEAAFRTSVIGQMEDNSSEPDLTKRRIYTTHNSCEGGFCRAYLNNGHQCQNGDSLACSLLDSPGVAGTTTCVNGSWGACVTPVALRAGKSSELETASN